MDVARYERNCKFCIFLGTYKEYDLYYHPHEDLSGVAVLRGEKDVSTCSDNNLLLGTTAAAVALRAAYSKAIKAGHTISLIDDVKNHKDLFPNTSDEDITKLVEDIRHGEPNVVQQAIEIINELVDCGSTMDLIKDIYYNLDDPFEIKERIIALRYRDEKQEVEIEAVDWRSLHLQGNAIIEKLNEEVKQLKQCYRDKSNIILELHDEATELQRANRNLVHKLMVADSDNRTQGYRVYNLTIERDKQAKEATVKLDETVKRLSEELKAQSTIHKDKRDELERDVKWWEQWRINGCTDNDTLARGQKERINELEVRFYKRAFKLLTTTYRT